MPKLPLTTHGSESEPVIVIGTDEQQAIWKELLEGTKNVIVQAVAGSGKTYTITEYAKKERNARVGLVAFNKHIAAELTSRVSGQSNVECMTYHSLGYKAIRNATRRVDLDNHKVDAILEKINLPCERNMQYVAKGRIRALVSLAKQYGAWQREDLERLVDLHGIDMNGLSDLVLDYTPKIMERCKADLRTIDFDDMVWLPMEMNLPLPKYDVLCVDEYQDTGLTQQWLALNASKRICAVGDPRQAIYQFRGADTESFDRLRRKLEPNVVTLPLTRTRRCPKSHVKLAQTIVPQIRAMDEAPEGEVRTVTLDQALQELQPGDLVLCRVNAGLVGAAYKLLRRGVKAVVRGRDIGKGIERLLLDSLYVSPTSSALLADVLVAAQSSTAQTVAKLMRLPSGKGESRAQAARDKYECLVELSAGIQTVSELRSLIDKLFSDFEADGTPKNAVVFGTVHRTKGLEAHRVYVLQPNLIPHPMAKRENDREGERNLAYVAVTRAKYDGEHPGELVWVGGESSLFSHPTDGMLESLNEIGPRDFLCRKATIPTAQHRENGPK